MLHCCSAPAARHPNPMTTVWLLIMLGRWSERGSRRDERVNDGWRVLRRPPRGKYHSLSDSSDDEFATGERSYRVSRRNSAGDTHKQSPSGALAARKLGVLLFECSGRGEVLDGLAELSGCMLSCCGDCACVRACVTGSARPRVKKKTHAQAGMHRSDGREVWRCLLRRRRSCSRCPARAAGRGTARGGPRRG